ncbi:alkene reductase [Rhodococcoides yunnanense]|uniref:alkene reductase n=1 Tax=Rhodococcoides yunnanense TaxID=278209 RepID=UPI0009349EDA|nr:alkene reductase [Rhodococcus yunnanensis]
MPGLSTDSALLQPIEIGTLAAKNRLFMAPLTRARSNDDGTPTDLVVEYYRQRAGAGLIISEATQPSAVGKGYTNSPGLHTDAQQAVWAEIADAVHTNGGKIFVQIMHAGRISHPDNSGHEAVAPSAIAPGIQMFTKEGMKDIPVPRALDTPELPGIAAEFVDAARRAVAAGLDGVELHAANGYILHQFLADGTNKRTDAYGGDGDNRARFVIEVVEAVVAAIGADKVGIRISPGSPAGAISEEDSWGAYGSLLGALDGLGLAYLHALVDPGAEVLSRIRNAWSGPLVVNAGFERELTPAELEELVSAGPADAVAIGRRFIANPDLVERWTIGAGLNEPDAATFYGGDARGYTDYPFL